MQRNQLSIRFSGERMGTVYSRMMLPRRSRSYLFSVFISPVLGSYSGTSFCAVPVLPPEVIPCAVTVGAKTLVAVLDGPIVTRPMRRLSSAAVGGGIT